MCLCYKNNNTSSSVSHKQRWVVTELYIHRFSCRMLLDCFPTSPASPWTFQSWSSRSSGTLPLTSYAPLSASWQRCQSSPRSCRHSCTTSARSYVMWCISGPAIRSPTHADYPPSSRTWTAMCTPSACWSLWTNGSAKLRLEFTDWSATNVLLLKIFS